MYAFSFPDLPVSPVQKQRELPGKIMFRGSERALEKTGQVAEHTDLAAPMREFDEADQIQHERRRQQRVAPLPDELQRHWRAQKAAKMNVVPGRFPVAQATDV